MYFSIGTGTTCRRQPKFDSVIQVAGTHLNLTTSRSTMFVQHPCCFVFYQFILKMQFNPTTGRHIFQRGVKTTWGLFTAQRARKSIVSSLQFNHARFTKHMRAGRQLDSFEFKFQTDRTGHVVTYMFFCDDHIVFLNNVLGTTQSMDGHGHWKNSRRSCATDTDRVSNSKRNRNKRRRIGQYLPIIGNGHSNTVVGGNCITENMHAVKGDRRRDRSSRTSSVAQCGVATCDQR